jgi:preprotein translocase subunit YajC
MHNKIFSFLTLVLLTSNAMADETAAAAHGGGVGSLIMFGAMFVMMYFLLIRPQSKKAKEHRNLIASLAKGDEILTSGGILGKIERDAGTFFIVALTEGVEVPVQKQAVVQVLPKGTLKSI